MTINEFNTRINLPRYCESKKLVNLEFVKIPKFGWYCRDTTTGKVGDIFDQFAFDHIQAAVKSLILDRPELHDIPIVYNSVSYNKLINEIRIMKVLDVMLGQAQTLFKTDAKMCIDKRYVNPANWFNEQGLIGVEHLGAGLITSDLDKFARELSLHPHECNNRLLIPTWVAPGKACSYELCKPTDLAELAPVYKFQEKGWYGTNMYGPVVEDYKKLWTTNGCTWDSKLDYWPVKRVAISHDLSPSTLLTVWREAKHIQFETDPLDILGDNMDVEKIRFHLSKLTLTQVKQLEDKFGVKLIEQWKTNKQEFATVGNKRFICKDNRYFMEMPNGEISEYSNFTLKLNDIVKKEGTYVRRGFIGYETTEVPFEISNEFFSSSNALIKELNKVFLEQRLGVPIVMASAKTALLDVVNKFNTNLVLS